MIVRGVRDYRTAESVTINNPWDASTVGEAAVIGPEDLGRSLDWAAGRLHCVRQVPLAARIECVERWIEAIQSGSEEIARLESSEVGKPIQQARAVVSQIPARLRAFVSEVRGLGNELHPTGGAAATESALAFSEREPLGLVAGILPFNSPVSALIWKIAPAFLMGNSVAVKTSELAPLSAMFVAGLLAEIDVAAGAIQVVNGIGSDIGPVLTAHPAVRWISFTGSSEVARDVYRRSADTLKRLTIEAGGNDAAVILDDADVTVAARAVIDTGVKLYSGQLCTAPKRCVVQDGIYKRFVEELTRQAHLVVIGNPLDNATELGTLINEAATIRVDGQVREAVEQGASVISGSNRIGRCVYEPTLLDVSPGNAIFEEPAFGPVVSIVRVQDDQAAVQVANQSRYALRAAVYSTDLKRAIRLARQLDAGGVTINGPATIGYSYLSVEPRKESGVGSEGVRESLFAASQSKFIFIKGFWE